MDLVVFISVSVNSLNKIYPLQRINKKGAETLEIISFDGSDLRNLQNIA